MASEEDLRDLEVELARVVDRLNSMPLARAAAATDEVMDAADSLLASTRELDTDVPADARLPRLGPTGLGAMLAVLGRDFCDAARSTPGADIRPLIERLTALRRALP